MSHVTVVTVDCRILAVHGRCVSFMVRMLQKGNVVAILGIKNGTGCFETEGRWVILESLEATDLGRAISTESSFQYRNSYFNAVR